MVFKYFLGIKTREEIKGKYKELCKTLHPDTTTGSHESFVSMKEEFEWIRDEVVDFPISNKILKEDFVESFQRKEREYAAKKYATPKQATTTLDPDELQKERAERYFNTLRQSDNTFSVIDDVIETLLGARKANVILAVTQLDDLTLDHFKYLEYKLKMSSGFARMIYKNYILNKKGW